MTSCAAGDGINSFGKRVSQQHAARERHGDAEDGGRNNRAALAVHQREIGFHAGEKQQKQDADLGDGIDHALERGRVRKDHLPQFRHQGAEHRGTKKHARQQLAEDGRLSDAAHHLAQHPAEEQQQDQLGRENCRRMVRCHRCPRVRPSSSYSRVLAINLRARLPAAWQARTKLRGWRRTGAPHLTAKFASCHVECSIFLLNAALVPLRRRLGPDRLRRRQGNNLAGDCASLHYLSRHDRD